MIRIRSRNSRVRLALAAVFTVSIAGAACSGGGGGGTATATPTPFTPTNCQLVWLTASSSNAATYNTYVIDMALSNWVTGAKSFSTGGASNMGTFYYGLDLQLAKAAAVGLATSGTYNVTVGGTAAGQPVSFDDADPQSYFDAANATIGGFLATNGVGQFSGEWSDPSPAANPTFGSGLVTILYQGSSLAIGTDATFGLCYDANAFAPETPAERGLHFLSRTQLRVPEENP